MSGRIHITFDIPITDETPEGYLFQLVGNSELRSLSDRWSVRKSEIIPIPVRRQYVGPQEDLD